MANRRRARDRRIEPAIPQATMPDKVDGEHRWIAATSYVVLPNEAAAIASGGRVVMDQQKLLTADVGCWDCEQPYSVVRGTRCPAGDHWATD